MITAYRSPISVRLTPQCSRPRCDRRYTTISCWSSGKTVAQDTSLQYVAILQVDTAMRLPFAGSAVKSDLALSLGRHLCGKGSQRHQAEPDLPIQQPTNFELVNQSRDRKSARCKHSPGLSLRSR